MSGFEKCWAINMGKGLAQTQTFFTPTFLWRWNSVYRNVSILSSRIQSHGTSNTNLQFRKIIFPLIFDKRVSIYRVFQRLVLISTQTSSDFFGRLWTSAAARVACRSLVSGFFYLISIKLKFKIFTPSRPFLVSFNSHHFLQGVS
jgi:hypothetical protein